MGNTVLLTDRPFGSDDIERRALEAAGLELLRAPDTEPETLAKLAEGAVGILVCWAQISADVVAAAGGCRVIGRYGIGYDNIDVAAATSAGIAVTYVPDYCIGEVADHTLALLLSLARGVFQTASCVRDGGWEVPSQGIRRLQGRRLALIGLGRIGREVARRARAIGLEVIAYDPYASDWDQTIGRAGSLSDALAEADVISLHAPLTAENRHMIGTDQIAIMRRAPILINASRGGLVDLSAVVAGLESGALGGVALDVTEPEPLPVDHPLRRHPRAIVTPHMSFYSAEAQDELQERTVTSVVDVLAGRRPRNPVNPEVLPESP